jgi:hypothetical protein
MVNGKYDGTSPVDHHRMLVEAAHLTEQQPIRHKSIEMIEYKPSQASGFSLCPPGGGGILLIFFGARRGL